jgi:hypothetical protein
MTNSSFSEFVEVTFDELMCVRRVAVYESHNAGSIVCIKLLNEVDGEWVTIFESGRSESILKSRVFSPKFPLRNDVVTRTVRVELDTTDNDYFW